MPDSEIAKVFQGLPKRFQKGTVQKPRTFYFSLDDDEKWTVALSPDGTQLFIGGHFGTARLQQSVCNNQPLHGLALLSAATGAVVCTWIPGLAPFGHNYQGTWSISVTNAYVWIGGGFTSVSGVGQRNVARFTI